MKFQTIKRTRRPLKTSPSHSHSDWELIYNVNGEGKMSILGEEYAFFPGTVALIPPDTAHRKFSDDTFEDYFISFSSAQLQKKVYVFEDDCDKRICHLLCILYSIYHERNEVSVCDSLFEALMGILRPYVENKVPGKYVQILQRNIISEFTNPYFLLKDAVCSLPLNQDYLRRQFKESFGCSPHTYLLQLRIENAKQLLSEGSCTVGEAAYCSGFTDPLYFSRIFKKITGVSPKQWK